MNSALALPPYIIGIDVETTSLDPAEGEIIDVAAIKYDWETGKELERFEQLCEPSRPITPEISALTGITNEMVAGQPKFTEIVSRLQTFIGGDTLFAHNADFDTKWLTYHRLNVATNKIFDTYLLATIAYPEATSYNLGMLAAGLKLPVTTEHRAAADVELTWELCKHLRGHLGVSPETRRTIVEILQAMGAEHYAPLFTVAPLISPKATAVGQKKNPADLPSLEEVFRKQGHLAQHVAGYQPRRGQEHMAQKVADCFRSGQVALIEAGTGTGKTFAYLVPAALAAAQGKTVVVSTYTKHLQDQLVEQDIPRVTAALGLQLKVVVVKGRRNYICDRRLRHLVRRLIQKGSGADLSLAEAFLVIKVLRWLDQGGSGDLEKLNLSHYGSRLTRLLHADSLDCRLQCKGSSTCPYGRAKQSQAGAQIMVVNHALLAQGAVSEAVFLQGSLLVIDEAHHVEAAARKATALDLSVEHVAEIVDSFTQLAHAVEGTVGEHIIRESDQLVAEYRQWLLAAGALVMANPRSHHLLLTPTTRRTSAWRQLAAQGATWRGRLKFIIGLLRSLEAHHDTTVQTAVRECIRAGERFGIELENFVEGSAERIQLIGVSHFPPGMPKTYLHDMALSVHVVFEQLFSTTKGGILTSATLTTRGTFDYIKSRTGLEGADALVVEPSFKYRDNMLIYLVDDGPLPADPEFENYLYKAILSLATLLRGRILALFTSQQAVKSMFYKLTRPLYKAKIRIYAQNMTGGRHNMLDKFRRLPESILLGTLSFWEGIDVPGDSLSCVVIPKLSFPAPDDPVLTAVAAHENLNAFTDLFVPQMILRLRQGVGRLLRSSSDRGVVVIFDPRLHRHQYGDEVLKSLPPATIHIGSGSDVIEHVTAWLGEEKIAQWQRGHI